METTPIINNVITFDEFNNITSKLDIRYGQIVNIERVPKSKKMLKLTVFFDENNVKTILTNIGDKFEPEILESKIFPFILNLPPSTIMGIVSEGMIILPNFQGQVFLNTPIIGSKLF